MLHKHKMIVNDIKVEIKKRYSDIVFIDKSDNDNLHLEFSTQAQLEYKYSLWFRLNTISASVGATLFNATEKQYFWYYPFDPYGSDTNEKKIEDCKDFLFEALDILTKYKTRIIQKKGLFYQTFICDFLNQNTWARYYKHSALCGNFDFPIITGRQQIYQ